MKFQARSLKKQTGDEKYYVTELGNDLVGLFERKVDVFGKSKGELLQVFEDGTDANGKPVSAETLADTELAKKLNVTLKELYE